MADLGWALAILVAIGAVCYQSTTKLVETEFWVTHTHEVLETLDHIVQGVTEAETSGRGYLLTGEGDYLGRIFLAAQSTGALTNVDKKVRDLTPATTPISSAHR